MATCNGCSGREAHERAGDCGLAQYELWLDQIGQLLDCSRADAPQRVADMVARAEAAEADLRVLREVRAPGTCQCSDDEACRFVRERYEAREDTRAARRERDVAKRIADEMDTDAQHRAERYVMEKRQAERERDEAREKADKYYRWHEDQLAATKKAERERDEKNKRINALERTIDPVREWYDCDGERTDVVGMLQAAIEDLQRAIAVALKLKQTERERDATREHNANLLDLLRRVEWVAEMQDHSWEECCPDCRRRKEEGHATNCKLAMALKVDRASATGEAQ
jgi:hypothetical protein